MNKFIELVELLGVEKELHNQINEINTKLDPIKEKIREINDRIPLNSELHMFLCEKILNTFTQEQIDKVKSYRESMKTYYCITRVFDPLYDSWYIFDYEKDGDKVRFKVSCRKNEGTISGLVTFLDPHYTDWMRISELERFD